MHDRLVVLIHAGAGAGATVRAHDGECRAALLESLDRARTALENGDDAVEAAAAAVRVLEDCEWFNAGRGAALCADGSAELSAAVMRGRDRAAGAVAGIHRTRQPIDAALGVLRTDEVLLIGERGDRFAAEVGLAQVDNDHFVTERQQAALRERLVGESHGTVGAVCLDAEGNLAAATSTGGLTGQPPGRVGDSPLIGAGTWADHRVAVSCTGQGEAFVRAGAARRLACLVEDGAVLEHACGAVLSDVRSLGGNGGLIALDGRARGAMPFSTAAMPRGIWRSGADPMVWLADG